MNLLANGFRCTIALVLIIALGYLASFAGSRTLAELYSHYALAVAADAPASNVAYDTMHLSTRLDGDNADNWRRLAILARQNAEFEVEDAAYIQALLVRPAWAYDWAAAARSLAERGYYDERLTLALRRSRELGPSEHTIHFMNAVTALVFWYRLSSEQRDLLEPSIEFILYRPRRARQLYTVIDEYNRGELFCRRYRDFVQYGPAWCHYLGIPPPGNGGIQ